MTNLVGVLTIVATFLVVAAILGANSVGYMVAGILGAALSLAAPKFWAEWKDIKTPAEWARFTLLFFAGGSVVYLLECSVGKLFHPEVAFLEAGLRTGPAGGIFTLTVTVPLVAFSLGGYARSLVLDWHKSGETK
jgi:hypothetical protein